MYYHKGKEGKEGKEGKGGKEGTRQFFLSEVWKDGKMGGKRRGEVREEGERGRWERGEGKGKCVNSEGIKKCAVFLFLSLSLSLSFSLSLSLS